MKTKANTKKKTLVDAVMEKEPEQEYSTDKGNWKIIDGDWVWVPVDKRGVPLTDKGLPGIPD